MLALGALIFFAIKPLLEKIELNANKTQEIIAGQEIKKKRLGEVPGLKQQFELVKKEEGKLTALITEDRAVELIEKMEKLADSTGNKIAIEVQNNVANKPSGTQSKASEKEGSLRADLPGSDYLEMKIKLEGNYNNLANFIEKLETIEYYCDIVSLEITPSEEKFSGRSETQSIFSAAGYLQEINAPDQEINAAKEAKLTTFASIVFYLEKQ